MSAADRQTGSPAVGRAALVVAATGGLGATLLFLGDRLPVGAFVSEVVYPVVAVAAALAMILGARRQLGRDRVAWSVIGAGVMSWGLGDVVWSVHTIAGTQPPYPGLPDVLYLAAYVLWFVGVLALPYVHGSRFRQVRLLLDAVVGTFTLAGLAWIMVLSDLVSFEGGPTVEALVTAAYPLLDACLVAALVVLALRRRKHGRLRVGGLVLGLVVTATADLIYLGAFADYTSGVWYDGLWMLGYGFFGVVAFDLTRPIPPDEPTSREHLASQSWFSYVVFGGLLLTSAVVVVTDPRLTTTTRTLLLVTGAVAVAVVVRVSLGIAENRTVLERERGEMIASVSHELRTPLTAIQGFLDLMADETFPMEASERSEMLATVQAQTRGLARIVTDLIEVSRDQLTSDRLDPVPFELDVAVRDAVAASAVRTGVTLDLGPCTVVADRQRFVQVVVNLVTNAARYGDGRIHIVAKPVADQARIEVHDGGQGVPLRYRDLIWERFERGPRRSEAGPGTGIGLALVRALVEAHGGKVSYVDSPLLGGACFVASLPVGGPAPAGRQLALTAG